MRFSILYLFVMIFLVGGCINDSSPELKTPENGKIIIDQNLKSQINSSPPSVVINDTEYRIESYAWRDFMPSINPPVRLIVNTTLIRTDGEPVQNNIEVLRQYVVKDHEIWRPDDLETRQNQSSPNQLNIISREGPTWEIGSTVTVGVEIENADTGNVYWFSLPEVEIVKTQ